MLYPQSDDRILATDTVTSLHVHAKYRTVVVVDTDACDGDAAVCDVGVGEDDRAVVRRQSAAR